MLLVVYVIVMNLPPNILSMYSLCLVSTHCNRLDLYCRLSKYGSISLYNISSCFDRILLFLTTSISCVSALSQILEVLKNTRCIWSLILYLWFLGFLLCWISRFALVRIASVLSFCHILISFVNTFCNHLAFVTYNVNCTIFWEKENIWQTNRKVIYSKYKK